MFRVRVSDTIASTPSFRARAQLIFSCKGMFGQTCIGYTFGQRSRTISAAAGPNYACRTCPTIAPWRPSLLRAGRISGSDPKSDPKRHRRAADTVGRCRWEHPPRSTWKAPGLRAAFLTVESRQRMVDMPGGRRFTRKGLCAVPA